MERIRAEILVSGVVQGVGFRPFVHRKMLECGLDGVICNSSAGVEITAEGREADVDAFLLGLRADAPSLARIREVQVRKSDAPEGLQGVEIRQSRHGFRRTALISPDVATCPDCLRELRDPANRRYGYPFINCTNCGPRFTIIRDVPYDRCNTSMARFPMCGDCASEYCDIADRRYHAQPDCCAVCGPKLYFTDAAGEVLPGNALAHAAELLHGGKIIAVKGLGGFHLACRADDPDAVAELRRRKHRDEKPFALMCRDMEAVRRICRVSAGEEALLKSGARPIVLLRKKHADAYGCLSDNREIGVMLPYTPLHHLLLDLSPDCLVMTSANLSDLPIIIDNHAAIGRLRGVANGFLMHDREIVNRCDDSLLRLVDDREYFLRRSRGYAPLPLELAHGEGMLLACGAEQKASFGLLRDGSAFQSPHIGDLKNGEALDNYERQIALYERLFEIRPEMIICDLHPDYLSTNYAEERAAGEGIPLLRVQHHHAHMAACMADNGLDGPCIGVIWDGVGHGTDGAAWGGEFLVGDYASFHRRGSIRRMPLPGGDRAVREIWRIGVALMLDAGFEPEEFFPEEDAQRIAALCAAGLNVPLSSGMGRLFDGACALMGIRSNASYEGQGAVLLEAAADEDCDEAYPFGIMRDGDMQIFDWRSMIEEICADRRRGVSVQTMAARFMNTLVLAGRQICGLIRSESGLGRVVLSGGVFQNMYLLHRLMEGLRQDGFRVYIHSRVPANDAGVSFGQLAVGARYRSLSRGGAGNVPCSTAETD